MAGTPGFGERIFRAIYPTYRYRWEVYNDLLTRMISEKTVWVDIGCGDNQSVAEHGGRAATALGLDLVIHSKLQCPNFVQASMRTLPFRSESIDLITLRMVVEHLEKIPGDFCEIERVLKPGGRALFMTSNRLSPVVFLPKLLSYGMRKWLIRKIFRVEDEDVFPTFHNFNTPSRVRDGVLSLRPERVLMLEQVTLTRPLLCLIFGLWYMLLQWSRLADFRTTLLAVLRKDDVSSDL